MQDLIILRVVIYTKLNPKKISNDKIPKMENHLLLNSEQSVMGICYSEYKKEQNLHSLSYQDKSGSWVS